MAKANSNCRPVISLNDAEIQLFQALLESLKFHNRTSTTLRVAGGWVRDKILGKESNDIDIAIDDQSGIEFATHLNEYLDSKGIESCKAAVIMANPEQSKHMETATVKVLGLPIDFVNLRTETYSEESRIPGIKFGNATEDALRRDFTINTLFFNINTNEIEDLTELGIVDLANGIIRTPVQPLITFKDDPLRILRAVRFSARFKFSLDNALVQAAGDYDVQLALDSKVSKERLLKELDGMFNLRPALALRTIYYLNIFGTIFKCPYYSHNDIHSAVSTGSGSEKAEDQANSGQDLSKISLISDHASNTNTKDEAISIFSPFSASNLTKENILLNWIEKSIQTITWVNGLNIFRSKTLSESEFRNLKSISIEEQAELINTETNPFSRSIYLSAAVNGIRELATADPKKKLKDIRLPLLLLRDTLKLDTDTLKNVQNIFEAVPLFQGFASTISTISSSSSSDIGRGTFTRVDAGLLLFSTKEMWRDIIWFSCADEIATLHPIQIAKSATSASNTMHESHMILHELFFTQEIIQIIEKYRVVCSQIDEMNLDRIWELKPLLDGNQLILRVNGLKKGPMVGIVNHEQLKWQLHIGPAGTIEDCIEHLVRFVEELK